MKPLIRRNFSWWDPTKNARFNKICNIPRPCAQNVQGVGGPGSVIILEGLIFYQNYIAEMVYVRKFVR